MAEQEKATKAKRPTALKRLIQNQKQQEANRAFKSRVRTAIRSFEASLKAEDREKHQQTLNQVYSLMDKGVKRGVFKAGKANRVKARMATKAYHCAA